MNYSWLMIAKGETRQHAGNLGYEDIPSATYRWDNTVGNHTGPTAGDRIALWDGDALLGASVIDRVIHGEADKIRRRCPRCKQTKFKARKKVSPKYRCHNQSCRNVFDHADEETITVQTYATVHEASWIDLDGRLNGNSLRQLCLQPKSQQSIRPLNWAYFLDAIEVTEKVFLQLAETTAVAKIRGGHSSVMTRVRLGQSAFRRTLLSRFGANCALTGSSPIQALDAAHLYSYAKVGVHHSDGGVLLRKDLHRLFDLGLIAIEPDKFLIDLDPDLHAYDQYKILQGQKLKVDLRSNEIDWIRKHWINHRG